jgi:DNA mismatch repair ATPase MutL
MLVPTEITVNESEKELLEEYIDLFKNLGFEIEVKDENALIKSSPVEFVNM